MTERSIWILLFTPSPIMSAMSTISTAITPLASSPLASFFRLIISLCPVSAPKLCYRNILLHSIEKNSILGQNCWRIIAFCLFVFFFFYNSPPSRQRRLISIRNSWKLLTKFRKGFDRRLSQSILSTDTSFFKFEAIKVIEKNVK